MINQFAQYLLVNRGFSGNTAEAYANSLREFALFINTNEPGTRWSTVTKEQIDWYVEYLVINNYAAASIKLRISALRTFFNTCRALGANISNPARYVSTPKLQDTLPKAIEADAITATLTDETVDAQSKAIIAIIYETGLRLQELLDITPADIDAKTKTILVHGKGSKERVTYYASLTERYFIGTWQFAKMSQREVRRIVHEALSKHSKQTHLSPHTIRHSYATHLLNNNMRIESVSRLLGHKHVSTTQRYARLQDNTLHAEYQAATTAR